MTLNALNTIHPHPTEEAVQAAQQGWHTTVAGNTPLNSPVDLHPALDQVRRMREFDPPQPGLLDEWLKQPWVQDLTHKLSHQLNEALRHLAQMLAKLKTPGMAHLPENIRDIFSGAVSFIIVMVSLFTFYLLLGWLLKRRQPKMPKPSPEARLFEQSPLFNSEHHYGQAQQAAQTHQYPEAVRQLYMATLCLLDEQGVVPYQSARTNLEYMDSLRQPEMNVDHSGLKAAFERIAQAFEASRYGHQPVQEAQFETSRQDYQTLQAETAAYG